MSITKITLLVLGIAAALTATHYLTDDIQEKIASFDNFNVTDLRMSQGHQQLKPAEFTQGQMSTMTFELRTWWVDVNSTEGWKKEWVSAFPGFAIITDKGKLNFHGEWVVLILNDDGGQYSKLLTSDQKEKIEKLKNRIHRWVNE